jgi:hypothetical protein
MRSHEFGHFDGWDGDRARAQVQGEGGQGVDRVSPVFLGDVWGRDSIVGSGVVVRRFVNE